MFIYRVKILILVLLTKGLLLKTYNYRVRTKKISSFGVGKDN